VEQDRAVTHDGRRVGRAFSLARKFGATFAGGCLAALFFVFNPWSLEFFGYFYYWTGYCLLPLLILGTIRIREGEKTPLWLPIAVLFLGGLVSWVMAAIVCAIVATTMRRGGRRGILRTMGRLGITFWVSRVLDLSLSIHTSFSITSNVTRIFEQWAASSKCASRH